MRFFFLNVVVIIITYVFCVSAWPVVQGAKGSAWAPPFAADRKSVA